ncbi:hypothetical protein ES702_04393 [subsurface metagenome]
MDKLNIQSILINLAIVIAGMMLVYRIDVLRKLVIGGK